MPRLAKFDTVQATADCCGFRGSLAAIEVHSCDVVTFGGRCEDYPCCGHTDGDGCQTTPEMTSAFYYRNPHLLHEPGSPEWWDAQEEMTEEGDEDEVAGS